MTKKINKEVTNIDIFASRTQSGKTTYIINCLKNSQNTNFNIVIPNSITASEELVKRIKRDLNHDIDVMVCETKNKVSAAQLLKKLIHNHLNKIQTVIIFMGNIYRMAARDVFAAQNAMQKDFIDWKVQLHVDESDLYIVGHDDNEQMVGKDLLMRLIVDSHTPNWEKVCFYTATIYVHALQVFSKESILSKYKISWNTSILENLKYNKKYWGYETIETESHDDLKKVWVNATSTFNPDPLVPIMEQLKSKDSIFFVHPRNACHNAILHWVQSDYDSSDYPIYCIIANQEGIKCTSRRGKAIDREFKTVGEAADWAISEGAYRLVWIGDQSLSRMQTLRDSENTIPLSKMVLLSNKTMAEMIIQIIGRMTGHLDAERYQRVLYATSEQINHFKQACEVDSYLENCLLTKGTITKEDFENMPPHPGTTLTQKRKMNGAEKTTTSRKADEIFENLHDVYIQYGKKNVRPLQELLSKDEAEKEIEKDSKVVSGQKSAGGSDDRFRQLIVQDPSQSFHERDTIFITPDGKYIDNRNTSLKLERVLSEQHSSKNILYCVTYNSLGQALVWDCSLLGKKTTHYKKGAFYE